MKKLFLMALVALMSLQCAAQDSITDVKHFITTEVTTSVETGYMSNSYQKFTETVTFALPDINPGDKLQGVVMMKTKVKKGSGIETKYVPLDIEYERVDANEVMHNLNKGVKVFANCEIVALAVSAITASVCIGTAKENPNVAKYVGIGGAGVALILHTVGIVNLAGNSMKNFYVSDKGVGFKIDIK